MHYGYNDSSTEQLDGISNNNNNNNNPGFFKRTDRIVSFAVSADHRGKNQRRRKKRQMLGPSQRIKKVMEHQSEGDTNHKWWTQNNPQKLGKKNMSRKLEDESRPFKQQLC